MVAMELKPNLVPSTRLAEIEGYTVFFEFFEFGTRDVACGVNNASISDKSAAKAIIALESLFV